MPKLCDDPDYYRPATVSVRGHDMEEIAVLPLLPEYWEILEQTGSVSICLPPMTVAEWDARKAPPMNAPMATAFTLRVGFLIERFGGKRRRLVLVLANDETGRMIRQAFEHRSPSGRLEMMNPDIFEEFRRAFWRACSGTSAPALARFEADEQTRIAAWAEYLKIPPVAREAYDRAMARKDEFRLRPLVADLTPSRDDK